MGGNQAALTKSSVLPAKLKAPKSRDSAPWPLWIQPRLGRSSAQRIQASGGSSRTLAGSPPRSTSVKDWGLSTQTTAVRLSSWKRWCNLAEKIAWSCFCRIVYKWLQTEEIPRGHIKQLAPFTPPLPPSLGLWPRNRKDGDSKCKVMKWPFPHPYPSALCVDYCPVLAQDSYDKRGQVW